MKVILVGNAKANTVVVPPEKLLYSGF